MSVGSLNYYPVPALLPEQLSRFNVETLNSKAVRTFKAKEAISVLQKDEGKKVLAIDIGGDKLAASYFINYRSHVQQTQEVLTRQSNGGSGYLEALLKLRSLATRDQIPVGISFAGPTDGTRIIAGPNLPRFVSEFKTSYSNDFANMFPEVEVANDAEAGIIAASLEAIRLYPGVQNVVYIINGSGLGGSILTHDTIYAAEPGHIEVAEQLNVFGQRRACGLAEAAFVCVEAVAASKAGIEDLWMQQTGDQLTGQEIAERFLRGDQFAYDLYEISARITAHAIMGMAMAFRLLDEPDRLAVVGHGGIFHVPGYGDRVSAIVERHLGLAPQFLFTRDFSTNACLDGSAIAAAIRALGGLPRRLD